MLQAKSSWVLALLFAGGALLSACGGNTGDATTNTPTSTLGTDSAATKVGGMPPADTTATGR